ncbi:MAG: 3-deoxy-D-manno-octulosonic acid transferase [Robiginitomaculum sp.]
MTVSLKFYKVFTTALTRFLPLYLRRRVSAGKEDPARLPERFGTASISRPSGPLVWMHAASVGESTMLLPLISHMRERRPDVTILITTGTMTSANLMAKRLPSGAIHQYAPADIPAAVAKFLNHWKPSLAIWAESELWPNMILQTRNLGIATALINGRMSEKSLAGWGRRKKAAQNLIGGFDLIQAADQDTANGLSSILERDIDVTGNLKYAGPALPVDGTALAVLKTATKGRPIWAAASTHHGEEGLVALAHKAVLKTLPSALLILAPRHPRRGDLVERILTDSGLTIARRSRGETPSAGHQVYLFDSLGEMGLLYALAPASCIAGSLAPGLSGHNPLEPARMGSAILSGANIDSFKDIYAPLIEAGGAQIIRDTVAFPAAIIELLTNDTARTAQIDAARTLASSQDAILDAVWTGLLPFMPERKG